MNIKESRNSIIIKGIEDFNLVHIFECGQCFRWNVEENNSYTGIAKGHLININKIDDNIILNNTTLPEFNSIWKQYFDLDNNYSIIKRDLMKDDIMKSAIEFGNGIRILDQDEWETLISFIISANNRIPMIKKSIENLCRKFGKYIGEYKRKEYYSFPEPEVLAKANLDEVKECKVGFRASRIIEAAKRVVNEKEKLYSLKKKNYSEASNYLKTYNGIGDKVAHCILLFSMKKFDAFPVDVWVRRVMKELYLDDSCNDDEIRQFAERKFGELSGYAQQYLFYYAREKGIGKSKT